MNALGMEVDDWGTCCFASIDNNGDPSPLSSVYAVFDPDLDPQGSDNRINFIGGIGTAADHGTFAGALADGSTTNTNNHFVAAINDTTDTVNHVSIVPNGDGELFGYGGIVYFSQVAIGSVPEGSSDVDLGGTTDIVDPSSDQMTWATR